MANRVFLVLAVAGLAAGQYSQSSRRPVQPPVRQGVADPSWQGAADPSWSSASASRPADRITFPLSRPPHIREECTAVSARVDLVSGVSDQVSGAVFFYQECPTHPVLVTGRISGLSPGKHGLHVHGLPNLTDQCKGAGGHFNPFKVNHGAQTNTVDSRHVGDLGNIEANYEGVAEIHITDNIISLFPGDRDIFRRAVVVHSGEDDLGLGGNEGSLKTGNAGMRLACGIIAPNNSPRR